MYKIDNTVSPAGNYGFALAVGLASICAPNLTAFTLYLDHCAVTEINTLLLSLPASLPRHPSPPHTYSACWIGFLAAVCAALLAGSPPHSDSSHSSPKTVLRLRLLQGLSRDCFRLDQTLLNAVFTPRSTAIISFNVAYHRYPFPWFPPPPYTISSLKARTLFSFIKKKRAGGNNFILGVWQNAQYKTHSTRDSC